uniref:RING-type domain-containing protein n=1 Tax=Timema genevievae TaxID=629358 RepID=A0A7R9K0Y6_TIMGE|nr:unnamed protein product [Timema genevievae]
MFNVDIHGVAGCSVVDSHAVRRHGTSSYQTCKSVGDDDDKFSDIVDKLLEINANLELLNIGIDNQHTHDSKKAGIENVGLSEKTSNTTDSSKQMRNPFENYGNPGGIAYEYLKQPEGLNYCHSSGMDSIPPYYSRFPPNAGTSMYAPSHPANGMQTPVAYPYSYPQHFPNDPHRYVPEYNDSCDKCCLGDPGNSEGGTAPSTQNYSHIKVIADTHSKKIHNSFDIDENTIKASYEETFNDSKNRINEADTPIFIADDSSVVENMTEENLDGAALTLLFKHNEQAIVSVGDNVVIADKDDDSAINKHISEDENSIVGAVDNNSIIENFVTKENSDSTATVQLIVEEEAAAAIPIGMDNNAADQIPNDNTITQPLIENKDDVACCSSEDISTEETLDDGAIAKLISEEEEEIASGVSKGIVEEYFDLLLNYIPEADPEYLQAKCESFVDDPTQLEAFVQECLETGNRFPSIDDYLKRQEVLYMEREHLNKITVPSLVEMFPRPFEYFYVNKKKEKEEENHEMGYLQRKFRTIADEHLKGVLERNNHNLSSSFKELELWSGVFRPKRGDWECDIWPIVNMPFLYEARLMESRLECGICCNNELEIEEMAACIEGHLFCKDCVTKNAELRFGEGHSTFPCLESCGVEFSMKTLQGLLNPTMFSRILNLRMLEDVKSADIENLEMCPFCEYVAIVPPEMMIFMCGNPECLEESCSKNVTENVPATLVAVRQEVCPGNVSCSGEVGGLSWQSHQGVVATLRLPSEQGTTMLNTLHRCLALSNGRKREL